MNFIVVLHVYGSNPASEFVREEMRSCLICLIVLPAVLSRAVYATITVVSSVEEALINDSTFFNCSTTSDSVEWLFGSEQYPQPFVYSYGTVNPPYRDRFRIEDYTDGVVKQFNLILQSVIKDDAGRYICRDPDSLNEEGKEIHLIVLETGPTCDAGWNANGVIGPNSCGIEPETVQLSCIVRYIGNKAPHLIWMRVGEYISIKSPYVVCSDSGHTYTCNLTMDSDLQIDGSSYICETTGSTAKRYNCTSKAINVIHAIGEYLEINATVNEKESCSVNSSQPCSYVWTFNISEEYLRYISYGQDIYLTSSGSYICEAMCPIRDKICTITAKKVVVSSQNVAKKNITQKVVPAVVCSGLVILSILLFITICKSRKKNEREQRARNTQQVEMQPLSSDTENSKATLLQDVRVEITMNLDTAGESDSTPLNSNGDTLEIKGYKARIRGLTLLNNELYVTTERQNTVEIFDSKSNMLKKKLTFESLIDPGTMASCTRNNCIYIIDKKIIGDRVEIFKYCPGAKFASRWLPGFYGRLSVTKETGNIVLAAYNRREKSMLKIFSVSTEEVLIRTIQFSIKTKIESLWHAVELSQGDFVVSHGCVFEESPLRRVCIVGQDGDTIRKSFGNKPNINELNEPSYLIVTDKGFILVADLKNHRVILLSNDLEFKKVLFENGEHLPQTMYFYEKNSQLFVGSNLKIDGDGRVLRLPCTIE